MLRLTEQSENGTIGTESPQKKALLESLSKGVSVTEACKAAGIGRRTYYNWLEKDPDFEKDVRASEQAQIQTVEDSLYMNALNGNVTAQIFYLCNRSNKRWLNIQRVESKTTLTHGGNITIIGEGVPDQLPDPDRTEPV
jgi:hypothetical protein